MKKYFIALFFCLIAGPAFAQCNGVFSPNQICGVGTSGGIPTAITPPLTTAQGGTGLTTYTIGLPLIGAASNTISQGTRSGSTTIFATTTGTLTNGHCVQFDGSGNLIDAGGACTTGGGGGTVSAGTQYNIGYYATTGTVISGNTTITTDASNDLIAPVHAGGSATSSTLTLESTTGAGATDNIFFKTASQVEAARIDNSQRVIIGGTAAINDSFGSVGLQVHSTSITSSASMTRWSANTNSPRLSLNKSRGASIGTQTAVAANDGTGALDFQGSDGANFVLSGSILGFVDGSVSTGIVPGRLTFSTANPSGVSTEALRIDSKQRLTMNAAGSGNLFGNLVEFHNADGTAATGTISMTQWNGSRASVSLRRSNNGTIGSHTLLGAGANVGSIDFAGDDGTTFLIGAQIFDVTEGVPAAGQMPTRLVFNTTTQAGVGTEAMRIDSNQTVIIGGTANIADNQTTIPKFSVHGLDSNSSIDIFRWSANSSGPKYAFAKSRGASIGTQTAVISGDTLGLLTYQGSDGSSFQIGAQITGVVDAAVSSAIVPGRLAISTANTSGVVTEAVRFDSKQRTIPLSLAGVATVFPGINGVVGDGSTDDSAAIFTIIGNYTEIHVYPGAYALAVSKTIGAGKKIIFHGGAKFNIATGVTWDFSASDVENPMDNQAFSLAGTGKATGLMNATPEEFGAKRDGSTDDSAALSACFVAVSANTTNRIVGNPTCWLSQGTYAIASQITVTLPAAGTISIIGGGQWGQPTEILSKTSVTGSALVITGSSQMNAVISRFQIINQTHGSGAGQGLYIGTNSGSLINPSEQPGSVMVDHMYVSGFATNYIFQGIGGVQVQFSQSWGLDSASALTSGATGMRVTTALGISGTQVDFTSNVIVNDNNAGSIGLELDDGGNASTAVTGCRLVNNVFYNGTGGGTGMLMQSSGSGGLVFDIWVADGNQFESQQVGGTTSHNAVNMVSSGGGIVQDIHINHTYMSGQGWNTAINAQINDSSSFLATIWITDNLIVAEGTGNAVLLSGTSANAAHMHGITVSNNIFYVGGSLNTLGAFQYGQDFTVMGNVTTLSGAPTITTGFSFFNTGNTETAIGNVTHASTPVFTSWTTTANFNNL